MARTNFANVSAIIKVDTSISADLALFIDTANTLVTDWVVGECGASYSAELLEKIERYLAAHFYAIRDPQYQSKSTGGASASFQGQTGLNLANTWWGQQAMALDYHGCLASINRSRTKVSLEWAGKRRSEQDTALVE